MEKKAIFYICLILELLQNQVRLEAELAYAKAMRNHNERGTW